ncbi:MAG TPA: GxxExxY protein [Gemmatimonadaceae bacterium]|nr:GxxExxY protein [Gemmatimonadaceae bacterium]
MEHEEPTRRIIGGAMTVHRALGAGFLESVYRNALTHELRGLGLTPEREVPIQVRYRALVVGNFSADMLVERCVLVETKAVRTLGAAHEVQLVNYLTATGIDIGLPLNFGAERLEFRRKARCYRPSPRREAARQDGQDGQEDGTGASDE